MVELGDIVPSVSLDRIFFINLVTFLIATAIFIVFIIGLTIFLVNYFKYRYKIVVFENVNGRPEPTRKDRAMEYKIDSSGDVVLYMKKHKKYLPMPSIQTGRRIFWYAIRSDGEWINIGMEDIDFEMRKIKARFLDKEMRHSRTALQNLFKERYNKPSFWSVYGGLIAYITLILITGIMMWLLFDKYLEIGGTLNQAITSANEVLKSTDQILGKLDNIKGGSLVPA